jgi:Domain of unknown function (DUF4386)
MSQRVSVFLVGLLVLVQAFLIFVPMVILGGAIDWPASLDFPPAQVLPLIAANLQDVRLGYGVYLLYSVLWAVMGTAIAWLAVHRVRAFGPALMLAVGLASASALARAIGIIRWLTASSALADAHAAPGADRPAIDAVQLAVNAWGGAIGENLGVAIFAGAWTLVMAVLILRYGGLPRWLGLAAMPVGVIVLLPALEMFGISLVSVVISTSVLHVWLMLVGAAALWQALRRRELFQ